MTELDRFINLQMPDNPSFSKIVNKISREEFQNLYPTLIQEKWFSVRELDTFSFQKSPGSLAGRYLIKKAIADHLNLAFDKSEIEILNNEFGKPDIYLALNLRRIVDNAGIKKIWCSISHSRNMIAGMTILSY